MLEFNRRDIKAMIMGPKPPKGPEGKNVLWMDTHSAVPLLRVWLNDRWVAVENTDSETIHIDFENVKYDVRELQSYFRQDRSIVVTNIDCRGGLLKLGNTEFLESQLITFLGFDDRITALEQEGTDEYTAGDNITIEDGVISAIDTTYDNATEETSGLMSYQDKIKLNSLNNYVLPKASALVLGGIKIGDTLTIDANGVLNALSSVSIDDTTIFTTKTWSSNKISGELSGKQDTLTAGQNIVITNNTISAVIDAGFQVEVVQTLPETGEANTIYFVPKEGGANPDVYDEYMYINNAWEKIGSTEVDLSNYYNKTEVDGLLSSKQDKLTAGNNITINGTTISANDTTYSAGANIDITDNAIAAKGYRYNESTGSFAEGDRDIIDGNTTRPLPSATGVMAHAEGSNTRATGRSSHAEGNGGSATGIQAHAEGSEGKAIGTNSHVEGHQAVANGYASHAEGYNTETGGNHTTNTKKVGNATDAGAYAHAEGNATIAKGTASHSEGYKTLAAIKNSHAEGSNTIANGYNSHAEGGSTKANGHASHTEGRFTKASCLAEHAQGSYNISHHATDTFDNNAGNTVHSIGIGTADDARKNAVEVMQNGDAYLLGVGNYDGIHIKGETDSPSGLKTLQETVNGKQDTLTAGENIDITNNRISVLGYEHFPNNSIITNGASCITEGEFSHAEGYQCVTEFTAQYSHAEGFETVVRNQNEHAQGRYNVSHLADDVVTKHEGNTIVSVGIGEDGGNRKNAFEIMQNGDIYVYGVGNYDGTATKLDDPGVMTLQDILKKIAEKTGVDIGVLF